MFFQLFIQRKTIIINGALNAKIVGQPAAKIAELSGVTVPEGTKILIGEVESVDISEEFAHEKLSPVLAMYKATSFSDALDKAEQLVADGGYGHTSSVYLNEVTETEKINEFAQKCIEKIEDGSSLDAEIPGNRPYVDYKQLPFVVSCDESKCVFCLECVGVCPEKAIPDDDPADVDLELCSRCTSCINICPENARAFTGDAFEATKPKFESANAERKEPEFYY